MVGRADICIVAEARPEDGVSVSFGYDEALVGALKSAFPKARWDRQRRCWVVPGVKAADRVGAWRSAQVEAAAANLAVNLAPRAAEIRATGIAVPSRDGRRIDLEFPYDIGHVATVKALPGAKFDAGRKAWAVAPPAMDAVDGIVAVLRRVGSEVRARRAAEGKPEVDEMTPSVMSRMRIEENEQLAKLRQGRVIDAAGSLAVGATFRHALRWRTVESLGECWVLDETRACLEGKEGLRGQSVQYAYTRVATHEEAQAAKAADPSPPDDLIDDDDLPAGVGR